MINVTDLLGIKFKAHGRNKEEGFDCYGLAIEVMRRYGVKLPDLYYESLKNQKDIAETLKCKFLKIEKPVEPCLLDIKSYGASGHTGVYIGDGMMIHSVSKHGVVIEPIRHYSHDIKGYYKVNS